MRKQVKKTVRDFNAQAITENEQKQIKGGTDFIGVDDVVVA
ncbi:MAG: hypothetical protein RLY31_1713 [Bacteroidota bacterium]|jgi:hypothetical protein